jgi:hypothetical protein
MSFDVSTYSFGTISKIVSYFKLVSWPALNLSKTKQKIIWPFFFEILALGQGELFQKRADRWDGMGSKNSCCHRRRVRGKAYTARIRSPPPIVPNAYRRSGLRGRLGWPYCQSWGGWDGGGVWCRARPLDFSALLSLVYECAADAKIVLDKSKYYIVNLTVYRAILCYGYHTLHNIPTYCITY